jgi:hypothetical protein
MPTPPPRAPGEPAPSAPIDGQRLTVTLEEYRIYVDTLERLVARRLTMHTFFISINTILLAGAAVTAKDVSRFSLATAGTVVMALAGIVVSFAWRRLLSTYGQLSAAKFDVIHDIEHRLPEAPFTEEWKRLQQRGYVSSARTEAALPVVFAALYLALGALTLSFGLR